MKIPILFQVFLFVALSNSALASGPFFVDTFTKEKKERRALRGDWKFENGIASVTQDDALYAKYKDHGPILFWNVSANESRFFFSFQATSAKTVAFTTNGEDGHVFRFVLSKAGLNVRAFPPGGETKSIAVARVKAPALEDREWTEVDITFHEGKVRIAIGEAFEKVVEHESFDRPTKNVSLGFSFGSLAVKEISAVSVKDLAPDQLP